MPDQEWTAGVGPWHTANGTAVTASGALTELTPTPQIVLPYPGLGWFPGKRLSFNAYGHYTTTASQGTINFDLRVGAAGAIGSMTTVCSTGTLTWVASQTNRFWHIEGVIAVWTLGAAGTGIGFMDVGNVVSGATDVAGVVAGTTAGSTFAVDTTQARAVAIGVTLSVASQSITCRYFGVNAIN